MPCLVTVGGFYGDEGKGKIIAYLAKKNNPTIAVRAALVQMQAILSLSKVRSTGCACSLSAAQSDD